MKLDLRRRGHIMISREFVEDVLDPDGWAEIMREIFPVKIDFDYALNAWHIIGVSRHFHPLTEGQNPPTYHPQLIVIPTLLKGKRYKLLWKRIEDVTATTVGGEENSPSYQRPRPDHAEGIKLQPGEDPK